ncbi:hypothetical protein AYL99_02592 [Fonsecaea erecta]|uniref:DUF3669 domain-containing protein n=1 Tax=Fonsecaea erecta TaxID=1367422 RepID=A0A178ZWI6_9EURO|nr:hypothetical protein AYL99_02592 [Fonsecaea erecta]OAP63365.1 hypothetical protein AYL99_02592 [Fonsecaea erecta]
MIKDNVADRDCLVRLYLGRRKIQLEARRGQNFFFLRNYPLHLNRAEELGLQTVDYARAMAESLAVMHWVARTNANDVKFVLGGPGTHNTGIGEYTNDFFGRQCLWVLDFDCCRPITMDDIGVEHSRHPVDADYLKLPEKFLPRVEDMHDEAVRKRSTDPNRCMSS